MHLVSYWEIVSPLDSQGRWLLHVEQHRPTSKSLPKPPLHFFKSIYMEPWLSTLIFHIQFSEWKTYVLTGKLKDTTYLDRYVALFNGVSRWVQGMVLNCVSPQERATCFEKFQQTAKVSN